MSKMITKLRPGEEIVIDGIVKLYRPAGHDKLRLVIESPIDLRIEKRIVTDGRTQESGKPVVARKPA